MGAPTLGCAKIDSAGKVTPLGPRPSAVDKVSTDDVQDVSRLAHILNDIVSDVGALRARWYPRRVDFEDIAVSTAGASVSLAHGFGGRVRWWLVGWRSSGTTAPILKEDTTNTTASTIVLLSYVAGTATIRVEESG